MGKLVDAFNARQRSWAWGCGVRLYGLDYCSEVGDNLFQPLSEETRRDFESGGGGEPGRPGRRGKMRALHSSSALACNFFDYWRGRDLEPLARALGSPARPEGLRFEAGFPTGLRGNSPNLDVVFHSADGTVLAVESKFTEWLGRSKAKNRLREGYFPRGRELWGERGLPGCQALAEEIRKGAVPFSMLHAAQLLRHMLGLAAAGSAWKFLCLWYAPQGSEADRYGAELELFARAIGPDAERFGALTYQELFERLCGRIRGDGHRAWMSYMRTRYF